MLDVTKLSNPYSGLGQFSLHLGEALIKNAGDEELQFLMSAHQQPYFQSSRRQVIGRWDRLLGVSTDADVWHSFFQGSPYRPRKKSTKVVLTVHDLNFMHKYTGWKQRRALTQLQHEVDRADALVAISNYTRQEMITHLRLSDQEVKVIYNGMNPVEGLDRQPSFATSAKFFFTIGIIAPKKNFHVLLPLMKEFPDHQLIIAGNNRSPYAGHLLTLADELGISDRVILPGEITEEEKRWLYRNCEAFLFPSLQEGFGLPVLEAMSVGKPVFLSTSTSLPEIGGTLANYFPDFNPSSMAEILRAGLADHQHQHKSDQLRQWASQFSWDKAANEYLALYRSL